MKLVHLSDIHVYMYTWAIRHLLGRRAFRTIELLSGRARKFELVRLDRVVERVVEQQPDHVLITGDLTTMALPIEFHEAHRQLAPLLSDPDRVTILPGNHDRTTRYSVSSRRFELAFGAFMPTTTFPWFRWLDDETAILGLDPTRASISAKGFLPRMQLRAARELTSGPDPHPRRLIVACHYPVAAPPPYDRKLARKRITNEADVRAWLQTIRPHLYCCGHIHAAWAFRPPDLPNQLCLNAGAPLLRDPTGLRLPGFLEINLTDDQVSVVHHAWNGQDWAAIPLLNEPTFF